MWNRVANVVLCAGELVDFNQLAETRGFGALGLLNSCIALLVALHADGYAPA